MDSSLISLVDSSLDFSISTTDSNIRLNFPNIPDSTESNFSISFKRGVVLSSGQQSDATSFAISLDTTLPTVSYSPIVSAGGVKSAVSFSTGVFNATITFSEQVYNDSSSAIDENNFTLSGFADNGIVPIITISNGRTLARFNNLSFAADTLTATISFSNIRDGVGNLLAATSLSISNTLELSLRSGNCSGIPFDGGSGVTDDPYQISNLCQLQNMGVTSDNHLVLSNLLSSHYELTAEIDASWTRGWNNGAGFSPIGNSSNRFRGIFNGNDYSVVALFSARPSANYVGFFGWINGASIRNIRLTNVDIQGNSSTGGLVGRNNNSTVQNSSSAGTIKGSVEVGGLVGYNNNNSIIQNSSAAGSVQGNQEVGGLVGTNTNNSIIQNSSSASSVQGNQSVGGLVGYNTNSSIQNSSAAASVSGNSYTGGLVGFNFINATVQNSYAIGSAQGNNDVGGLVGFNNATVQNSYWNFETSGQNTSSGGDARTSSQLLNATSLFPSSDGTWDYGDNLSYPTLTQNVMDTTTQALHQVAYMIRLADAAGTDFFGASNQQQDFTMDEASIPSVQDATIFALDVNAEANNNSSRVDFWDCSANSNTGILLTTGSVNNASVTLQYGEENTINTAVFEKGTTPLGSCEVVRTNTGSVQAGDVLHLEAVISKGSGLDKRSYVRSFRLTLE